VAAGVVSRPPVSRRWAAVWDPESEVLILTVASAVLAGLGVALIMMGALPQTAAMAASASAAQAREAAIGPLPAAMERTAAGPSPAPARSSHRKAAKAKPLLGRSVPVTLEIPAIGVHTRLMSLGLKPDGTVEVPPVAGDAPAGWYRNLATPGEPGPAVILGHVDSAREGPAVFYRLRELRPGDRISVRRADGRTAVFTVRSLARYPKKQFPTEDVYGSATGSELRLVTCGGSFDTLRRHYRDNIVVYAALTRVKKG
jgi:sortase (surface protein transpeptidase)